MEGIARDYIRRSTSTTAFHDNVRHGWDREYSEDGTALLEQFVGTASSRAAQDAIRQGT